MILWQKIIVVIHSFLVIDVMCSIGAVLVVLDLYLASRWILLIVKMKYCVPEEGYTEVCIKVVVVDSSLCYLRHFPKV